MEQLQQRRDKQQKLEDQRARKKELDRCLRLKMKRLAREQEEELQADMSILEQVLTQHTDQKQQAAQQKVIRQKSKSEVYLPNSGHRKRHREAEMDSVCPPVKILWSIALCRTERKKEGTEEHCVHIYLACLQRT